MGFFRRKEEPPKLPRSSQLPDFPSRREQNISELPTMPANVPNDNLSENMIKSAMDDDDYSSEEDEVINGEYAHQMGAGEMPKPPLLSRRQPIGVTRPPERDTIFVKIDEFNKAKDSLEVIDDTMKELAADIQALREVKLKEVEELTAWEEELKKINTRLSRIDSGIFGEV